MRNRTDEDRILERKLIDMISELVKDTSYVPQEGGILTDVVVIMGHIDSEGDHGISFLFNGSPHTAEGMLRYAVRNIVEGLDRPTPVWVVGMCNDDDNETD